MNHANPDQHLIKDNSRFNDESPTDKCTEPVDLNATGKNARDMKHYVDDNENTMKFRHCVKEARKVQ